MQGGILLIPSSINKIPADTGCPYVDRNKSMLYGIILLFRLLKIVVLSRQVIGLYLARYHK